MMKLIQDTVVIYCYINQRLGEIRHRCHQVNENDISYNTKQQEKNNKDGREERVEMEIMTNLRCWLTLISHLVLIAIVSFFGIPD